MIAYKLFRVRKDGTLGSLFIDRKKKYTCKQWLSALEVPTKGFAVRAGWHCCKKPVAPHLSMKDRRWYKVDIFVYKKHVRPEKQGGVWYTAQQMKILGPVDEKRE